MESRDIVYGYQVCYYGRVGHGRMLEWYVPISKNRRLTIVCAFGARISCCMCVLLSGCFAHVPSRACEVGRVRSGVQYERTWVIGHVVLHLFVFLLVNLVVIIWIRPVRC